MTKNTPTRIIILTLFIAASIFSAMLWSRSVWFSVCGVAVFALFNVFPREASEMFHSANSVQNPAFRGLWVHSLKTSDKVLKYGENNKVDFSEHPTVVKRGSVRTINIYAAVPDVA